MASAVADKGLDVVHYLPVPKAGVARAVNQLCCSVFDEKCTAVRSESRLPQPLAATNDPLLVLEAFLNRLVFVSTGSNVVKLCRIGISLH